MIERLVEELRGLVNADAADCWTLLAGGSQLVCRAVLGLPETEVGRTIPAAGTDGEAITTGKPVLRREFAATEQPAPRGSYADFAEVMDAPIFSFGEIRAVLGVCSREPGPLRVPDLRLIEAFASLASIALRNAELYEESKKAARRSSAASTGSRPFSASRSRSRRRSTPSPRRPETPSARLGRGPPLRGGGELELAGAYELSEALAADLRESAPALTACAGGRQVLASRRLRDDDRFGEGLAARSGGRGS